mgnify:CR=1 FL=1
MLERLYFIAIIPPLPLREEITRIKEYFADHHKSKHALRSPPHITLIPPFKYPEEQETLLELDLKKFAKNRRPFLLELNGFGAFPPRVIYIEPVNNPQLFKLHDELLIFMKEIDFLKEEDLLKENNRAYRPHLTVAHRDLNIDAFNKAWPDLKKRSFIQSFYVDSIFILKNRKGGWDIRAEINLTE